MSIGFLTESLVGLDWAVLVYFVVVNGFYLLLLSSAALELLDHTRRIRGESRARLLSSHIVPRISILAPAYNEQSTVSESVRALLTLNYPNLELIVINDGSRDRTLEVLKSEFRLQELPAVDRKVIPTQPVVGLYRSQLHPEMLVIDKQNGRKADAMNAGLNLANGDLVCAMDADTLIEPDALQRLVRPFLLSSDVVAAGGTIRIANGSSIRQGRVVDARAPRKPIPGFQVIEYLRAFMYGRLGWNRLGGNLIISGAFGLFRRDAVIAVGGYAHDTVGEDMELVLKLRRRAYEEGGPGRVAFVPDPVAWTEAPETLSVLGGQRDRWHRGLADTLWRHRAVFLNPRYGAMGMLAFPYYTIIELLAPVVEMVGLIALALAFWAGAVDLSFALLFFLLAYGIGIVLSALTLLLEDFSFRGYRNPRDQALLLLWAVLENIGYRQLTVLWRIRGLWKYFRGRNDWGEMQRRGLGSARVHAGGS